MEPDHILNILVLAPHTDDETVGCGGFINRMSVEGHNILIVAFSHCNNGSLITEFENACKVLAPDADVILEQFDVRQFTANRQRLLDCLIKHRQFAPDVVLCPASYDVHQDHNQVYQEAIRAFKGGKRTILGYSHQWNTMGYSNARLSVLLTKENIAAKKKAMKVYKSQSERDYFKDNSWVMGHEHYEVIQCVY